jgi:hypothetical protein
MQCLIKPVLNLKTRGDRGSTFGELRVADVTENDVAAIMAQHAR